MQKKDKAVLALFRGECCCCCKDGQHDPGKGAPVRPQVHGRPRPARAPQEPEDAPFAPVAPPSFDSPQRPAPGHLPGVDAFGAFVGTGSLTDLPVLTLDDGTLRMLRPCVVNHVERWAEFLPDPVIDDQPPDLKPLGIRSDYAWADKNDPRVTIVDRQTTSGGLLTARHDLTRVYFDGREEVTPITLSAPFTIYKARVRVPGVDYPEPTPDIPAHTITEYRLREAWFRVGENQDAPDGPDALWRRRVQVYAVDPQGPLGRRGFVLEERVLPDRTRREWERLETPPNPQDPNHPETPWRTIQVSDVLVDAPSAPPIPYPTRVGPRFTAPGVTVWGSPGRPYTDNHALLEDGARLEAHGHTFETGSWAALCGPTNAQGVPEVWVLHHAAFGRSVALITRAGVTRLPLLDFELDVLRTSPDTFREFHPSGTLTHTWPPHWALCDCGAGLAPLFARGEVRGLAVGDADGGLRAVVRFDPWRDTRAGEPPEGSTEPPFWWWKRRPKRRPTKPPVDPPVPPLPLTLADVFAGGGPPDPGGGS
ncbi:hypothetical protein [Deinococcus multiflagellatus]|uniref:hypothetical protein n=1 Tax=Deinococcus multiflagellatus TaxID=1656887 RepID=UPI001CCF2C09|nr:hypothetical protein [Deinococcus multiflagellatus]MBZ9715483.1 hypothetical protein [Deinococcus multiflagellatus]